MAKALKTLKFPGIAETYTVPVVDDTLSIEGAAADAKAVYDAIQTIQGGGAIGSLPDMAGILPATKGGTGLNGVAANNFLVGSGSAEMTTKTAEEVRELIGAAKESEVLPLTGGTMSGTINMGGQLISNLATPTVDSHATTKAYVDEKIAQNYESTITYVDEKIAENEGSGGSTADGNAILFDGICEDNVPVEFSMIEGDKVEIIYEVPAHGSNTDVYIKANNVAPSRSRYWFSTNTTTTYEDGLVARTGEERMGTLEGTLTLYNGLLRFNGTDNRGQDNGVGISSALWYNTTSVSNISFSIGGYLRIRKLSSGLTNLTNKVFYGQERPDPEIGAIWLRPIE